jgi:hypothetical protein
MITGRINQVTTRENSTSFFFNPFFLKPGKKKKKGEKKKKGQERSTHIFMCFFFVYEKVERTPLNLLGSKKESLNLVSK